MGLDIEFGTDIDPKKPVDVWLCGLAAASNDLLVAVKNYLDLEQTDGSVTVDPNLVEVHQAEKRYYFRLASAHSCEALKYISLDFDKKDFLGKESSKRTVQTFIDSLATATRCKYKKLLSYCSGPHSFQELYLSQIRHVTFHYLPNEIQKAIQELNQEKSAVIITEEGALKDTRYVFADEVILRAMEVKIRQKHDSVGLDMRQDWVVYMIKEIANIHTVLLDFYQGCLYEHLSAIWRSR